MNGKKQHVFKVCRRFKHEAQDILIVSMIVLSLFFGLMVIPSKATANVNGRMGITAATATEHLPTRAWNVTWNGTDSNRGAGVAVDGSGNAFVTGYTGFNGSELSKRAFLAKFSPAGIQLWNRTWGGLNATYGNGVAMDGSGNAFVVGVTENATMYEAFLAKYASNGTLLWNCTWGIYNNNGFGDAVDASGAIYIVGMVYMPGPVNSEAFIAKYATNGTLLWNRTWGGNAYESGNGVAVDANGNSYLAGQTNSYGNGTTGDAFLVKYAKNGTQLWNCTWGGSDVDRGNCVTTDSSGNAILLGYTFSFGTGGGYDDGFIAKYTQNGIQSWNHTWGGRYSDLFESATADAAGNIYVTGSTSSWTGNFDLCLLKYSATGVLLWNTTWGYFGGDDRGLGLAMDTAGNIYATGSCMPPGSSNSAAMLIKYTPYVQPTPSPDYSWVVLVIIILAIVALVVVIAMSRRKRKKRSPEATTNTG